MPRKQTRPPHEIAEEALIVGIMQYAQSNLSMPPLHGRLQAADFAQPSMATAFQAASNLLIAGVRPVPEAITTEASRAGGGVPIDVPTLHALLASTKSLLRESELTRLSEDIVRYSNLRRISATCKAAVSEIEYGGCSPEDVTDRLQSSLLATYTGGSGEPADSRGVIQSVVADSLAIRSSGQPPGFSSGIKALDDCLIRLRGGINLVIAGRPGMGKTALMDNIVDHITDTDPTAVAYVASLEFTKEQSAARRLACKTGVPFEAIMTGKLSDKQAALLEAEALNHKEGQVYIDTSASLFSMRELCSKARRLKAKAATQGKTLRVVALDSLQLFADYSGASREQAIASISNQAKKLAMELDVVFLLLSALNREVERRESRRPQLSDLRESGAIEQDADQVVFVYRESVHDRNAPEDEADLIVAKNRWGRLDDIKLSWDGARYKFSDYKEPKVLRLPPPPLPRVTKEGLPTFGKNYTL